MKALVVDFGGVLTTNVFDSFRAFCRAEGLAEDAFRRLYAEDGEALAELHRLELGQLAEDEFCALLGPRLGLRSHERLIARLFEAARPETAMLDAVAAARAARIRTGLVSNSLGLGIYERGLPTDLFDAIVVSGEVGLRKPDPAIYLLAGRRLGVAPVDCVFVDDLRTNCEGAERVGMTAVLHRDPAATIVRLEELLGVTLVRPERGVA